MLVRPLAASSFLSRSTGLPSKASVVSPAYRPLGHPRPIIRGLVPVLASGVRCALPWLAAGLLALPAVAQEDGPVSDFFDTVEVNVVNIEVFVSDKMGEPVTGLTVDDFELLDEGEPVEIDYFFAAGDETAGAPTRPADRGALRVDEMAYDPNAPGGVAEPRVAATPSLDEQLTVVLFVDSAHILETNLDRVIELMRGTPWFQEGNRDRVMVVSYRGSDVVDVVQGLTTDPSELASALDRLAEIPTQGHLAMLEYTRLARSALEMDRQIESLVGRRGIVDAGNDSEIAILFDQLRNYAEGRLAEVRLTVETLERFVGSLAGLPGRKSLVYVSDGLPLRPAEALFELYAGTLGSTVRGPRAEYDASTYFRTLADTANGQRVTFYTLLAGGKTVLSQPQVASQHTYRSDQSNSMDSWSWRTEAIAQSNLRAPAEMIAEATGGRAFTEPKRFDQAILEMRRDATHYYSLGYSLPFREAGRKHPVEVRLKNDRWKVRHRKGYHEKSAQERMTEHTLSALMFGEGDNNPLGVALELGEEEARGTDGEVMVPLVVKLPISRLLLLPQETHHVAQVAIFVGVRDTEGRLSPVRQVPAQLRIPNDQLLTALGQVASYQVALVMRPGEHTVVVGVRDELADVEAMLRFSHHAGAANAP